MKVLDVILFGVIVPMLVFCIVMTGVSIAEAIQRNGDCERLGGVMYRHICLNEDAVLIG